MEFETVMITPKMARDFLSNNVGNRDLRKSVVKDFSEALKRGEWRISHQGVAFSTSGRLLDGQHRLSAIAETGISAPMVIARGVPEEAFCVMDIGVKRTLYDIYHTNPFIQAAISCIYKIQSGDSNKSVSPQTFETYYSVFGPTMERIHSECPRQTPRLSIAAVKAAACLRMHWHESSDEYVVAQYSNLVNMDFNEMSPTMMALYKLLYAPKKATNMLTFERAYIAFDDAYQDRKRIVVRERGYKIGAIREKIRTSIEATANQRMLINR